MCDPSDPRVQDLLSETKRIFNNNNCARVLLTDTFLALKFDRYRRNIQDAPPSAVAAVVVLCLGFYFGEGRFCVFIRVLKVGLVGHRSHNILEQ